MIIRKETQMLTFNNDPEIKAGLLAELELHKAADLIIQGYGYWKDGKGCAVGCTLHSYSKAAKLKHKISFSDHSLYDEFLGAGGQMLGRLEDYIFEGLPSDKAKAWPSRFLQAIEPGKDLSLVGWKFLYWILTDEAVNPGITHPLVKDVVVQAAQVILALSKGETSDTVSAARSAALAVNAASAMGSAAYILIADTLIEMLEAA